MRKVRDVLRLKHTLGMRLRQISEATGIGKTVVGEYVLRCGRRFHPRGLIVYSVKLLLVQPCASGQRPARDDG